MSRIWSAALAGGLVLGCSVAALAAPQKIRVRGTIESVSGDQVVIKTYNGKTTDLTLEQNTKFISVLPASLSDIGPGDFIGAGATGPESRIVAMEVVIFPNSMRGSGEGHYGWSVPAAVADADLHKAANVPSGAPPVQGTMTNGTVASAAPAAAAPPVQGTMTNGTVATSTGASSAGGRELTVTYGHGGKVQILVPAATPVVRLQPAERPILEPGAKAFAVASTGAGGSPVASVIAVGKDGLMPPM